MRYSRVFCFLFVICLLIFSSSIVSAEDMVFDSFEEAEKAAKERAAVYKKRIQEHLDDVNNKWEKQQNEIGDSTPDISDITETSDSNKTSASAGSNKLENSVNDSINRMKNVMVNSATPQTTGFAGGAAGYQYSVKCKNGKYVLSDSYNEADFFSGNKKEQPADSQNKNEPSAPPTKTPTSSDSDTQIAKATPQNTPPSTPSLTESSSSPSPQKQTVSNSNKDSQKPNQNTQTSASAKPSPVEQKAPAAKGIDIAPTKLPQPDIRMVIQHPTDFSEEVFSSNSNQSQSSDFKLNKFQIPEDTRIKIAVEVSKNLDPNDVALVITDQNGDRAPVTSNKMKNYRHMFRVPSPDKYAASVYYTNPTSNQKKKVLSVKIPVTKLGFKNRTINSQRSSQRASSNNSSSQYQSAGTSSYSSGHKHDSFNSSNQVDLSDLYSSHSSNAPASRNLNNSNQTGHNDTAQNPNSSTYSQTVNNSYQNSETTANGNQYADNSDNQGNSASGQGSSNSNGSYQNSNASASGSGHNRYTANSENTSLEANSSYDQTGNKNQPASSQNEYSSSENQTEFESQENNGNSASDNSGSDYTNRGNAEISDDTAHEESATGYSDPSEETGQTENDQGYSSEEDMQIANAKTKSSYGDQAQSQKNKQEEGQINNSSEGLEENQENQGKFVIGLSIESSESKLFQSFDFLDSPYQVAGDLKKDSELSFSMSFASQVDTNSVQIEIYDGKDTIGGDLNSFGESFSHVFSAHTPEAYIKITGNSGSHPFKYELKIPVTN